MAGLDAAIHVLLIDDEANEMATISSKPLRVMLDAMIHDVVCANTGLRQLIEQSQADGLIVLNTSHIQRDQLARIPAVRDVGQATAVSAVHIPTSVAVWGVSKWGESEWGAPDANAAFANLQKRNPKHTGDAIIGASALDKADILVTDDRSFRNRFKALQSGVQALSSDEFEKFLAGLARDSGADQCPPNH